jgi:ribose transport system permease protein
MRIRAVMTRRTFAWPQFTPVVIATMAVFLIGGIFIPQSVSGLSLQAMLPFAAVLAIAAVGQTLVIQQRGIDLSVGGFISLSAMGVGITTTRWGWDFWIGVLVTFLVCAFFGLVNAMLVAVLNIAPLVATLATNALLTGLIAMVTGSAPAAAPGELAASVSMRVLGQPLLIWTAVVFVGVMAFVAARSVEGRRFVAAGANPAAARVSGVRVNRSLILAYVIASLSYALAGVLLIGHLKNAGTGVGGPYMLSVIAVVIVGGTPLIGGKGTIIGSAVAAIFMSQLMQMILSMGAPSSVQMLVQAIAIAAAATLQGLAGRSGRSKIRPESKPTGVLPLVTASR